MTAPAVNPAGATWRTRAACKWQPDRTDLWFSAAPSERRMAAHICLSHCPVFVQCDALRKRQPCGESVHAAVLYDAHPGEPRPVVRQPNPDEVVCRACNSMARPKQTRRPGRPRHTRGEVCGTAKGIDQHRRDKTPLCEPCRVERLAMTVRVDARRNGFPDADAYTAAITTIRRLAAARYTDREIGAQTGMQARKVRNLRRINDIPSLVHADEWRNDRGVAA